MKTIRFFALAAMAFSLAFTACDSYEPVIAGQEEQRGDSACRIESFVLTLGDGTTELIGDVYDYDKSIDVLYDITQLAGLKSATATAVLSEGATISPTPSTVQDYTEPVSFTVTAADGTQRTYTTRASERIVNTYTKVSLFATKTPSELGVGDANLYYMVGVSGTDVVIGTKVFHGKTLSDLGNLNMTGVDGKLAWMTNDDAGHLVAGVTPDGNYENAASAIYAWIDGWNTAPKAILGPSTSTIAGFLSVKGDLTSGEAFVVAMNGAGGSHYIWHFLDGARVNKSPNGLGTGFSSWWTQQASPASNDTAGTWFVTGGSPTGGYCVVKTFSGWSGEGTPAIVDIPGIISNDNKGGAAWGNLNVGSVRSFTFNEMAYGALLTKGWGGTYTSIVDGSGNFLLDPNSTYYDGGPQGGYFDRCPTAAFILDPADNCGYLYTFEASYKLNVYKLEIAIE